MSKGILRCYASTRLKLLSQKNCSQKCISHFVCTIFFLRRCHLFIFTINYLFIAYLRRSTCTEMWLFMSILAVWIILSCLQKTVDLYGNLRHTYCLLQSWNYLRISSCVDVSLQTAQCQRVIFSFQVAGAFLCDWGSTVETGGYLSVLINYRFILLYQVWDRSIFCLFSQNCSIRIVD